MMESYINSGTIDYSASLNLNDDNWTDRANGCDQFNQVMTVNNGSGALLNGFGYDGTSERSVQMAYPGGVISSTRAFLFDWEDVIAEFSNDTSTALFRRYIHGPGIEEPLAILKDDVGDYMYFLHNGLGSVNGVVNDSGKIVGTIDYSAFSETLSKTVISENRFWYTSRCFVETHLYYYHVHDMRPVLGQIINMETVYGAKKPGYVKNNNPLHSNDHYGEFIDKHEPPESSAERVLCIWEVWNYGMKIITLRNHPNSRGKMKE